MGVLRFYLATSVFIWHCWQNEHHGVIYSFAAVYCFFIMSGFYISMVLSKNYAGPNGTVRFYANRALRLYPTYLVVTSATALAYSLGLIDHGVPGLNSPFHFWSLVDQLTVLPRIIFLNLTLNTVVEQNTFGVFLTVGLEMIFYALAPFFVRWKLPNLILLFMACGILHFVPFWLALPDRQWQYEFFASLMVFFVAGSLSYRLYEAMKDTAPRYVGWLLPIGIAIYGYSCDLPLYTNQLYPVAIYAALVLMMPFLFIASSRSGIDKLLGNISYPFYVVHPLAAELTGGGIGLPTDAPLAFGLAVALALALYLFVERPIDRMRALIRRGSPDLSVAPAIKQSRMETIDAVP